MENLVNPDVWQSLFQEAEGWLRSRVFLWANLIQFIIILALFLVARFSAPAARGYLERLGRKRSLERVSLKVVKNLAPLTLPAIWLGLQWITFLVASQIGWPHDLMRITVSLLTAWIIITLSAGLIRDPAWARAVAITAWTIAALSIVDLLDDTSAVLDGLAITLGGLRVSALLVIKGVLSLVVLLWGATICARVLERRITQVPNLTPAFQVLFVKLLKIVLITIAIVVSLSSVGIDLTAFAVFGGAIGVGIGFGLQKIVSNLISGVIILLDKSIKPGDVISLGETFGWINSLGARYASIVTRDGTEWLVPNEDLITQQVVNWSYSNDQVRLKIPIGISYNADPRKAIELCFEAAKEAKRILKEPKSNVLVKGFGDSSVDLEMRVWINDPQNGVSNIKSEILLSVWEKFHEHGIEIPYPQRDLHIKPPAALHVVIDKGAPT